jgi:purine-binding chemotaxis protein CheW
MTVMESSPGRERTHGLFLVFQLDDRFYGLPVTVIREILPLMEITPVPNAPSFIRGVFNLRGVIVPVVDLRLQLRLPERSADARTCLVVAQGAQRFYGFLADRVSDCLEISDISHPETVATDLALEGKSIHGIGQHAGQIVILLDPDRMLSPEDWKILVSL